YSQPHHTLYLPTTHTTPPPLSTLSLHDALPIYGGIFGSMLSTPILNPPQTGVLGMHAIQDRPVARDKEIVIRPMMYLALTYDHRSEEHTSELQSRFDLVCRLLLEKKKKMRYVGS